MSSIWELGPQVTYPAPPAGSAASTVSAARAAEIAGRRASSSPDVRKAQAVSERALRGQS